MTRNARVDVGVFSVMAVAAVVFAASGPLSLLSEVTLLRAACVVKLVFLATGAVVALRVTKHFGADNPVRPAWLHLGLGLAATTFGQLGLACYQFSPAAEAPFPSLADYFFFLGDPFFILALTSFAHAYEAAGYALGTRAERWRLAAIVAGAAAVVGIIVLRPVVLAPPPMPEMPLNVSLPKLELILAARAAQTVFLNIAYPVLDLILLVVTVLLLKASLPLRGGEVFKAWAALLAGFAFMSVGDVLFAYFSALKITAVDPFVHVTYVLSYGFLALGVLRQQRLLAS
jgi:hypothetical protein